MNDRDESPHRILRYFMPGPDMRKHRPRTCEEPNCFRNTCEGKPRCSRHVLGMPYAKTVLEMLAKHESEKRAARPTVHSNTATDMILVMFDEGPCSVAKLGHRFKMQAATTTLYLGALLAAGFVAAHGDLFATTEAGQKHVGL